MGGLDSQGEDEDEVTDQPTTNGGGRATSGGGDHEQHSYTSIKQRTFSPGGGATTTPKTTRRFNDSSSSRSGGSSYYHEEAYTPAHYLKGRRYYLQDKDANDTYRPEASRSPTSKKKKASHYQQVDSRASTNGRFFVACILAILISTGLYFANENSKIALRNSATFQQPRAVPGDVK